MIKGVTDSGFEYEIDPAALNDFYLLEQFALAQKGDVIAFTVLLEKMLGPEQKAALLKHCEDEAGRVPIGRVGDEIVSIYRGAAKDKTAKNS